eukprot:1702_1
MYMKKTVNHLCKHANNHNDHLPHLKVQNYLNKFQQNSTNNNIRATQLINGLLQLNHNIINTETITPKYQTIATEAVNFVFTFCDTIITPKDNILVNSLLQLCFEFNNPYKCLLLWNDINTLHLLRDNISYSVLLKCLIELNEINKCMQVCKWMEISQYTLKIHESFITTLITNCNDINHVKYIHLLIDKNIIKNRDKYVKTHLIFAYSKFRDVNSALNVFNCIPNEKKDIVSVGAIMTTFIDNNCDSEALDLYDEIESFNNDIKKDNICDNLAIKACGNIGNLNKGISIYKDIEFNKDNIQIQNSLIDFFGDCGQIEQALNVFNSMDDKYRDIVSVGALMKGLIHNEYDKDALKLYDNLSDGNIKKTGVVYSLALKACTKLADFERGKAIH